jgi:hypothetical protein
VLRISLQRLLNSPQEESAAAADMTNCRVDGLPRILFHGVGLGAGVSSSVVLAFVLLAVFLDL